jgi:tetratricopeptide (TPR) repeat protein
LSRPKRTVLIATLILAIILPAAAQTADQQAAIDNLTKSIQANPKNYEAYFDRSAAYLRHRKFELAIADVTKVIELLPDPDQYKLSKMFGLRAAMKLKWGKLASALADVDKALSYQRLAEVVAVRLSILLDMGVEPSAKELQEGGGESEDPRVLLRSGDSFASERKFVGAMARYDDYLEFGGDNAVYQMRRKAVFCKMDDRDAATRAHNLANPGKKLPAGADPCK